MKILLIYPYPLFDRSKAHEEDIAVPPIGIFYIGALLKENGYDVEVLNWYTIHKTPEKVAETFRTLQPDLIGFSILNANRWGGIELARIAKKVVPSVRVVFGGVGATFLWKHFLDHFPVVDYLVLGEGEYTFLELVNRLAQGAEGTVGEIPGLAFRRDGQIVKTPDAPFIQDLDALPIPARHFTYHHVISSRGCPGRCTFCGSPRFWARKVRFRSPENFVKELALLYARGISFFYFSDDTFTIKGGRVVRICKGILDEGMDITWFAISRADCITEKVLYWMRKAGCIQISYGVESGSKRIRRVLGKPVETKQIQRAFASTHRYGILARAYFIYGAPGETWDTIRKTIELIHVIRPFVVLSYILEIYPGTQLYADYLSRTQLSDDIWLHKMEGILYFETDPALTKDDVLAYGRAIREALYANLSTFAEGLELEDDPALYELHGDFCSRLAMTFSHGDYSTVEAVKNRRFTAQRLFRRALSYAPTERAYLGLGILKQQEQDIPGAVRILSEGLEHFPESEGLSLCLATNLMNQGRFRDALRLLLRFEDSPQALPYIADCYRAMGDAEKAARVQKRARHIQKSGPTSP